MCSLSAAEAEPEPVPRPVVTNYYGHKDTKLNEVSNLAEPSDPRHDLHLQVPGTIVSQKMAGGGEIQVRENPKTPEESSPEPEPEPEPASYPSQLFCLRQFSFIALPSF